MASPSSIESARRLFACGVFVLGLIAPLRCPGGEFDALRASSESCTGCEEDAGLGFVKSSEDAPCCPDDCDHCPLPCCARLVALCPVAVAPPIPEAAFEVRAILVDAIGAPDPRPVFHPPRSSAS